MVRVPFELEVLASAQITRTDKMKVFKCPNSVRSSGALKLETQNQVRAFTLIETLVVVLIIGLLLAIVAPAMNSIISSTRLATAMQLVEGQLTEAQQLATALGRPVEVRFYQADQTRFAASGQAGNVMGFDAMLVLTHYAIGESDPVNMAEPLTEPLSLANTGGFINLPSGVVISESEEWSTLTTKLPNIQRGKGAETKVRQSGSLVELQTLGYENYRSFLFLPEGTNLGPGKWFLTIVSSNDVVGNQLPKQFYTIQIDPVTARLTSYRP